MTLPTLFAGESAEVLGLGPAETLRLAVEQRRVADEAAARELTAVTHWCDLHRAEGVGAVDRSVFGRWQGEPVAGREGDLRLAGEGAFAVEEFAVAELATALGMSEPAARAYVGQALELRDRLPRLWAQVHAGAVPAWKGRRVAEETIPLSTACAEHVDRHLAPFAGRLSVRRILRAVHGAVLRHDPAEARARARAAAESRGVWLGESVDGVVTVTAVADAPDAVAFDRAVAGVAADLAALGDADAEQVRRARALGILADPQHALDLHATRTASDVRDADGRPALPPRSVNGPVFHLHLHADALDGTEPGGDVVRSARWGPLAMATVERWLAGLAPGSRVAVTPVVDLRDRIAVDAYEVPDRLRAQVEQRDACCVFPHCGRGGRFDADHIEPYVPRDDGGPPAQTSSDNLARLCRFHHRVKTRPGRHGTWHYERAPDGGYHWTSPLGHRYTVDHTGTRAG